MCIIDCVWNFTALQAWQRYRFEVVCNVVLIKLLVKVCFNNQSYFSMSSFDLLLIIAMKELITNGWNRDVNENYIDNSARTHSNDPHHKNHKKDLHVLLQIHHWLYSEIMITQNKTALTKIVKYIQYTW